MKRLQLVMMLLLVGCTLASCGKAGQNELDRGVSAIEDAMNAHNVVENPTLDELIKIDADARAFVRKRVGL